MQFNQTNNNAGDVNNAISKNGNVVQMTGAATARDVNGATSEKGNVVQTSGTSNKVQVDQQKENFWSMVWMNVKACWKWLTG
jgi:hypothetical protein